jgi:hypothetical protein
MDDVKNENNTLVGSDTATATATATTTTTTTAATNKQSIDPKKSLKDILGTKRRSQVSPSNKDQSRVTSGTGSSLPQDPTSNTKATVAETIHTVIRLLAETKKVTNAAIKERLSALDRPESTNREFHKAIQTISALSMSEEGTPAPETWEAAARTEILYNLRDQIVGRVMLRNRRAFENSGPEEGARMVNALGQFRRTSRNLEVRYASRENMAPGSSRTDARLLMDSPKKAKTAALEEIVYTLTQIAIGTIKDTTPKISTDANIELQRYAVLLQNPRSPKPDIGIILSQQKETILDSKTSKDALVSQVSELLKTLCADDKDKEKLAREIAIFDDIQESIGTNIETLDSLAQEEFSSVKSLETIYDQLDSVKRPESYTKPETPEELQLAIFQGIREIAPSMGKTTTMVMTSQLSKDPEWVEKFLESGTDAIYNAPSYKNLIVLTEPENTLFGQPGDPEQYMEEGKTLRDALNLIYKAESSMYTRSVQESLAQKDRDTILAHANKVLHEDISDAELKSDPVLSELSIIQENAEKMANAVSKEMEGSEKSLEVLPSALKEKERQDKVAEALNKTMSLITKDEVSSALERILRTEEETLSALLDNPDQTENDKASIVHTKEKIATLEALRDFSRDPYDLENKEYEDMISTIALTRVPRTLREHALISLCDNKAADGTRLKTKDMLMRLETESGVANLTNMIRSSIGTLRHYKERESAPVTIKKRELAISVCRAPENLKKSMKEEMRNALKSCLIPPPWKSPFNTTSKDLGNCNTAYLIAKKEYGQESPLFKSIRALHSKTAEIQKESGNSSWVRAEKIALDLRNNEEGSLKNLEKKVLNLCLNEKNPKEALDYLSSWYNSIGYEATLQEETLHLPEEGYYHFEPIPMVAAKIQTKIENLFEIGKYLKAVSRSPEALAETYIQHRLHEKKNTTVEAWEERLERSEKRVVSEINQELRELKEWKEKFNSIFEDQDDDDLTPEEIDKNKSMRAVCHRKIMQKERATETLILKKERLRNLKQTSLSLKGVKKADDIGKALGLENKSEFGLSMESALNAALKLANSPSKIVLPPKIDKTATPLQMLEAGAIEQTLKNIKSTLKEAQEILKVQSPAVAELDIENVAPEKSVEQLKKSTFKVLKEIEMHLWESGQSIKLSKEEEEEFLQSNPEMIDARKDWVDTLKKTDQALQGALEYAKTQPKVEKRKPKDKDFKEPPVEDFEHDMVAA